MQQYKNIMQNAIVFKEPSQTVQREVLDCMLSVLREQITEEIQSADFILGHF